MTDDCEIATNLIENILANVKILRDYYSSCIEGSDFEMLVEDVDFQWFLHHFSDTRFSCLLEVISSDVPLFLISFFFGDMRSTQLKQCNGFSTFQRFQKT